MTEKTGVLFVHSQDEFQADAAVHADLMRFLDHERFEVHVACTSGGGNGEPVSLRMLRAIPRLRVRPTQFLPVVARPSWSKVRDVLPAAWKAPRDFVALQRYVRANRIRIIHASDRPRNAVYGVVLGKLTGAKSIVHVHVKWSKAYSRAARWGVDHADAVFGISQYVTSTVIGMGCPAERVHTVLNGIDPTGWDPAADRSSFRQELGIGSDVPLLASVSRLFSWKGQRELLRAFALSRARMPALKLAIVGEDASGQISSFKEELRALAAELGVSEHVIFTGRRSDVPQIMAACDVFTLPSFEEPFGLVFLEAMATARPVVALNNGGTPEVVEHGRAGLLSAPGDIEALAANISTLALDPELRRRFGHYGRERVLSFFNAERMAADAVRAYDAVLRS
jgi:glycosyltransferase involved in cell wall biosynthesis